MAPFTTIFGIAFAINILAIFRSSPYWEKCKKYFGFGTEAEPIHAPLLSNDDLDEKGKEQPELTKKEEDKKKHSDLLKRYLGVYLLAVTSDWLQGPYVYALYDDYGYSQHEIAILFVAGFGSSMVFGTFVGGLVDTYGRKKFTIVFTIIYALSCLTKHFKSFGILMIGRLLGGIATSLLFSVFDAWLIRSHSDMGISSYISKSFSIAICGNSTVAILAGLLANAAASSNKMVPVRDVPEKAALFYKGGYLNPFDLALLALVMCAVFASLLWDENYGDDKGHTEEKTESAATKPKKWHDTFTSAFYATVSSKEILYTGIICSLFEGSMYIFVFMWTPALKSLTEEDASIPFGLIFATFMVACMTGSSIFSVLVEKMKNERIGQYVFFLATCCFIIMAKAPTDTLAMIAFLLFEMCVGCYFPMIGTMKSIFVPENKRVAVYNLYRIPLNFIVLFSLLTDLSPKQSFFLCTLMMSIATFLQVKLVQHQDKTVFSTAAEKSTDLELGETQKLAETPEENP